MCTTSIASNALGRLQLTSLPVDVLYLIRDAVHESPTQAKTKPSVPRVEDYLPPESVVIKPHPLRAVSTTCQTLRSICLPSLFRHMVVDGDLGPLFPPSSIWPYI
ncbi:hypothetical protein EXIGLDRAFT_162343 [Exidia glandulosa HHB12029]|uniref:F-box domain-containing protein n=1 Tax=Exidia glandulosa HHB12029 TaxID=1314781 RepID=A0A165FG58_EXIGL|nr:hypothetical protein EXIGLDRAFT_162343 [Exidia glandulosa HHB12029]